MQFNIRVRCSSHPEAGVRQVTWVLRELAEQIEAGTFRVPEDRDQSVQRLIVDDNGNEIGHAAFLRLSMLDGENVDTNVVLHFR